MYIVSVYDHAKDSEHLRLNSVYEKSQLDLRYLIHQGNTCSTFRATGFELRSDAYGATQGLLLFNWGQIVANDELKELTLSLQLGVCSVRYFLGPYT